MQNTKSNFNLKLYLNLNFHFARQLVCGIRVVDWHVEVQLQRDVEVLFSVEEVVFDSDPEHHIKLQLEPTFQLGLAVCLAAVLIELLQFELLICMLKFKLNLKFNFKLKLNSKLKFLFWILIPYQTSTWNYIWTSTCSLTCSSADCTVTIWVGDCLVEVKVKFKIQLQVED